MAVIDARDRFKLKQKLEIPGKQAVDEMTTFLSEQVQFILEDSVTVIQKDPEKYLDEMIQLVTIRRVHAFLEDLRDKGEIVYPKDTEVRVQRGEEGYEIYVAFGEEDAE